MLKDNYIIAFKFGQAFVNSVVARCIYYQGELLDILVNPAAITLYQGAVLSLILGILILPKYDIHLYHWSLYQPR